MIINPKTGSEVLVWYRKSNSHLPYHDKTGTVIISSNGKPRNHLIKVGDSLVVIPCGNIRSK